MAYRKSKLTDAERSSGNEQVGEREALRPGRQGRGPVGLECEVRLGVGCDDAVEHLGGNPAADLAEPVAGVPDRRLAEDVQPERRLAFPAVPRSEEHTSELQSQFHLVCRLLLE